jgi:hypothetical protein
VEPVEGLARRWGFWRRWRWRLRAARRWGLRGFLLPIGIAKDGEDACSALEALFASVRAPLTLTERLPYVQELNKLACDIVLPRLWGYDFAPETTVDEVIARAAELLDHIEELRGRDGAAAEIVRDLAYSYTDIVYRAVDELASLEGDERLAWMAVALYYLRIAIIRCDREYVARAAEEAVNAGIAASPERLRPLLGGRAPPPSAQSQQPSGGGDGSPAAGGGLGA